MDEAAKKRGVGGMVIMLTLLFLITLGGAYYGLRTYNPDVLSNLGIDVDALPEMPRLPEFNFGGGFGGGGSSDSALNAEFAAKYSKLESENDAKDKKIKRLESELANVKATSKNAISQLGYYLKPMEALLAACVDERVGRWEMSQKCASDLLNNAQALLSRDVNVVAIEVSGVVDKQPYLGRSPELKQEGLASFRALEAIELLSKRFPSTAIFEGVSLQEENMRGFVARAYFVETRK